MVCSVCGEEGHNIQTCPAMQVADTDTRKRGARESPRTPSKNDDKMAKLRDISKKLSPSAIPPLPGHGADEPVSAGGTASGNAAQSDPYLAAIEKLSSKMDALASKADVDEMKSEVIVKTKIMISEAVDPLKTEFRGLQDRVAELEKRPVPMQGETGTADPSLKNKVEEIEKELATMKVAGKSNDSQVGVIGNLHGTGSLDEAETWVRSQLSTLKAPAPLNIYIKGDDGFKGHVFVRFTSSEHMQTATALLDSKKLRCKDKVVWAKSERPIQIRAPFRFLIDFKRLLIEWKVFDKSAVRVDEEELKLVVGGLKEEVLQVRHDDGHLCLTWLSREWQDWADLHNSQEFKDLISKCNTMLEQTKAKGGKSKGKGL